MAGAAGDEKELKRAKTVATVHEPVNLQAWIDANKASFKPPVCNKLMCVEQAIVF